MANSTEAVEVDPDTVIEFFILSAEKSRLEEEIQNTIKLGK